eukprot:TRINITY_DN56755_c0_g2_i1.p1 TRINITY_DN56755_c0_g2~~TRINITY_DN56755_c0_g2_i1.p1  ORF type:complete len:351 (-),score=18.05 TRINITY_DN56755_c0_g2_i1:588-1616(-)
MNIPSMLLPALSCIPFCCPMHRLGDGGAVVIVSGLRGAGKTSTLTNLFERFAPKAVYISEDQLYIPEGDGMPNAIFPPPTRARRILEHAKSLAHGGRVALIDCMDNLRLYSDLAAELFHNVVFPLLYVLCYNNVVEIPSRLSLSRQHSTSSHTRNTPTTQPTNLTFGILYLLCEMFTATHHHEKNTALEHFTVDKLDSLLDSLEKLAMEQMEDTTTNRRTVHSLRMKARAFVMKYLHMQGSNDGVYLQPRFPVDLVLNTSERSVGQVATQLAEAIAQIMTAPRNSVVQTTPRHKQLIQTAQDILANRDQCQNHTDDEHIETCPTCTNAREEYLKLCTKVAPY